MSLLKELCETPAISGREQPLIEVMRRELGQSCDSVRVDGMGNVIGFKKGSGKNARKIMIAGHMDEIGFVVSHIDKDGFIRISPRGGHVPRVLISQRVRILGRKGAHRRGRRTAGVPREGPRRVDPRDEALPRRHRDEAFGTS